MGVPIKNKEEKVKTISNDWENEYDCDCPNLCVFEKYSLIHTETIKTYVKNKNKSRNKILFSNQYFLLLA